MSYSALLVLALALPGPARDSTHACIPSCSSTDARFLSVLGPALGGATSRRITGAVALPPHAETVKLGIFDGDSGGQWDSREGTAPLVIELFEDPSGNGTGTVLAARWDGAVLPDGQWADLSVPVGPGARSAGGAYFYRFEIRAPKVSELAWDNFKLRVPSTSELRLDGHQLLTFAAGAFALADLEVLYPDYPATTGSPYDGEWLFRFWLDAPARTLDLWDGDFDFGAADCSSADTDDANSPPTAPPWDPTARPEGVAVGELRDCGPITGANGDDSDFPYFLRTPSIFYSVRPPSGATYRNRDPSGNEEWEVFRLAAGRDPTADVESALLDAGAYELRLHGVDLSNAFSWYLPGDLIGTCELGLGATACSPHFTP